MLMWMEPAGSGRLINVQRHRTFAAWRNNSLRAAVDVTRYFQPVPVQRRLFRQLVIDINRYRFAAL
ncbi:Uncharacterised protein [Shigella sonnei]|nr:Uncharacterised protein [Shigella sonnei]CSH25995.1 Uncharacterised protein [Shigella sonnei]CSS05166.1 Uncharacterised protein [Shigella sonnei]